ncbi:MAG: hypothetical protein P1U46_03140 [Patescibacteria group bacterium]|nr:hypothetical protein [Patescibacteria group bacterium]
MKNAQTISISIIIIIVGNNSFHISSPVLSFIEILVSIPSLFNPKSFIESFFGNMTIFLSTFSIPFSITLDPDNVAIALFQSISISLYTQLKYFCSNSLRDIFVSTFFCAIVRVCNTTASIKTIKINIQKGLYLLFFNHKSFKFGFLSFFIFSKIN